MLRYTNADRYRPLEGYKAVSSHWHLAYTNFLDDIKFANGLDAVDSVASYWQLGAAIGKEDRPIKLWFMKFDRLGLAYNHSSSGRFRGIKFVFRSMYEL